jgi:hypothetical protein
MALWCSGNVTLPELMPTEVQSSLVAFIFFLYYNSIVSIFVQFVHMLAHWIPMGYAGSPNPIIHWGPHGPYWILMGTLGHQTTFSHWGPDWISRLLYCTLSSPMWTWSPVWTSSDSNCTDLGDRARVGWGGLDSIGQKMGAKYPMTPIRLQ